MGVSGGGVGGGCYGNNATNRWLYSGPTHANQCDRYQVSDSNSLYPITHMDNTAEKQ